MKINSTQNSNTNFSSIYTNKFVLKGLEKIADHPASFSVGASFVGAVALRPFVISRTPKTNKENKKYLSADSLSSGIVKLLTAEIVALPIEKAIKNIETSPKDYLNKETVKNFYSNKNSFDFLGQIIKQSANLITTIPKSYLTVALIPIIMDKFFNKKNNKQNSFNPAVFRGNKNFVAFGDISFKGRENSIVSKGVSKIINNETIQNLSDKYSKNSSDITRNMTLLTDSLLTVASVFQIKKSKKIKEDKKNPIIYNNLLSAIACGVFGFSVDEIIKKSTESLKNNFKCANKNNPKLLKYLDGVNILRTTTVFALIYYGILPVATSYLSDKIDKTLTQKQNNQTKSNQIFA